ncbi:DUF6090 family protein [Robiginitalea sp.]|uniref:DUF6090 family protein n=1 Tax=Robiginitalea sp. TaxID=1902411 RepID=UPI003C7122EE
MINFFRKIRKQLADQNKPLKYFRYAIGEILLVVIGILIALQIDNWNEERKVKIEEQILLNQLREDYQTNLDQLDSKIEIRTLLINSSKKLLTYFDDPDAANKDSLVLWMGNLGLTLTFDPIENDLVASGKINIIQNQKLKTLLTKWTTNVVQVQEVETIYLNSFHYVSSPVINEMGMGRAVSRALYEKGGELPNFLLSRDDLAPYDFKKSRLEPDMETLLNNAELEGIVTNSIIINELINSESFTLRRQILEILDLLDALVDAGG